MRKLRNDGRKPCLKINENKQTKIEKWGFRLINNHLDFFFPWRNFGKMLISFKPMKNQPKGEIYYLDIINYK